MAAKEWLDRLIVLSLCGLIFVLPFSKSAVEICFVAAFILWALKMVFFRGPYVPAPGVFKRAFSGLNPFFFLLVLANILSVCCSTSIVLSLQGFFFKFLEAVLLFCMIADTVNSREKLNMVLGCIFLSMALMVTDGLFQAVTGWDFLRHYNKVHGIQASFANRIAFGAWLVVMIPIALSFTCADKKQIPHKAVKGIICVVAVMLVLCLVLALSRGALIGFAFAMMFFVMARSKKIFLIGTILILVASVLGAAYFISVNADGNKFFMQFTKIRSWDGLLSFIKDLSAFMRWQVAPFPTETNSIRVGLTWEALLITNRYPIFGCGLNTYSVVARACPGVVIGTYPHNSYLQMAAETGLVGLASFMLFVSAFFVYSIKRVRSVSDVFVKNLSLGLLSGLAGFLVHSFFDVHLYSLQLSILMWYIMGLVMAVQNTALNEQYA